MFTVEQIKAVHARTVKTGADFPRYISEIAILGVRYYATYVRDGHTDYSGADDYRVSSPAVYAEQTISAGSDPDSFKKALQAHQQGHSDYLTFCRQCAAYGMEKWAVCLEKYTCTYFDLHGWEVLVEQIPQV